MCYILGWEERTKLFVLCRVAFTWGLGALGSVYDFNCKFNIVFNLCLYPLSLRDSGEHPCGHSLSCVHLCVPSRVLIEEVSAACVLVGAYICMVTVEFGPHAGFDKLISRA